MFRVLAMLGVSLVVVACGGDNKSPTAPSPPPPANIGGTWTGTWEFTQSSGFRQRAITLDVNQAGANATGNWIAQGFASGTFSASIDRSSLVGNLTISTPAAGGGTCQGSTAISGTASGSSLRFTSAGFTQTTCTNMPTANTFTLQRR